MDLAFALSATAGNADRTFKQMRDVVNTMIDKYGVGKVQYGVFVFDSLASTKVEFGQEFDGIDDLKKYINRIPRSYGSPKLDVAIAEADRYV